jgi:predicted HTH domain antitoxin
MLIEIPNYFFGTLRYFEQDLKIDVAILLYHRKALTLARAARW